MAFTRVHKLFWNLKLHFQTCACISFFICREQGWKEEFKGIHSVKLKNLVVYITLLLSHSPIGPLVTMQFRELVQTIWCTDTFHFHGSICIVLLDSLFIPVIYLVNIYRSNMEGRQTDRRSPRNSWPPSIKGWRFSIHIFVYTSCLLCPCIFSW